MASSARSPDADLWWQELPAFQRTSINEMISSGLSYEEVAETWLSTTGAITNAPFGGVTAGPGLFENIRNEINKLVCGHESYDDLRKQSAETWEKYKPGVLMGVAGAIGAALGVAAVVIVPVVALLLAAVVKVGVNAWCQTKNLNEPGQVEAS